MTRKSFVKEFLGALGAQQFVWYEEKEYYISGRVIFDSTDPEEYQDFCWHVSEANIPSEEVFNLVSLINSENLLNTDKVKLDFSDLYNKYISKFDYKLSYDDFTIILNSLFSINVCMVDDGKETDSFFIHT